MKVAASALLLLASFAAHAANFEDYARVVSVQERMERTGGQPRQVCDGQAGSSNGIGAGTVIGAVAGGLLGGQVGKGNGKVAAAAVGAATGAITGNRLENNNGGSGSRCYTVQDYGSRPIGYDVTYEYNGRTFTDFSPVAPAIGAPLRMQVNLMVIR